MCQHCTHEYVDGSSLPGGARRSLAYLGTMRHLHAAMGYGRLQNGGGHALAWKARSKDLLTLEWQYIDRIKQGEERPLRRAVAQVFESQAQAVLQRLPDVMRPLLTKATTRHRRGMVAAKSPLIVAQLFDVEAWKDELEAASGPAVRALIEAGFSTGFDRIGIEAPFVEASDFTSSDPRVSSVLQSILDKTRGVQDTLATSLASDIQTGLTEGDDIDDIAGRVRSRFDNMTGWKAQQIAQTAGTGGFERGQLAAFTESGVTHRAWLTQRDGRVRGLNPSDQYDHAGADGQTVKVNEPFTVSGESLMHPADPAGSAGNTIWCRCSTRPIIRRKFFEPLKPSPKKPSGDALHI